ncbi:lymphocyte antigen 75-like [Ostrea edulis]|uniref:lymphocyte antigen 75-like n=1 Tax=Ostrea edulis TaxID=37623 RepID=UPI0024AF76A0|nr:lymphocyte antigen 75-like [Ostrea edulis]
MGTIVALFLLLLNWRGALGFVCYDCVLVEDPQQCNLTKQCLQDQLCFVTETIDDSFNLKFHLGCATPMECSIAVRKRKSLRSLARQCCVGDMCNRGFRDSLTTNSPATTNLTKTTMKATLPTTSRAKTPTTTSVTSYETTTHRTSSTRLTTENPTTTRTEHRTRHHHDHNDNHHHTHKASTTTSSATTATTTKLTTLRTEHTTRQHNHTHNEGPCQKTDWIEYNRHFYYSSEIHGRQRLTNQDAVDVCQHCKMELLSIHSLEEQVFVHQNLSNKNEIWLGLQNNHWMDGSPRDFSYWKYPNDANAPCIVMDTNQQWYSDNCYRTQLYVCKTR